jgi:microcompartment protein CcmK/EutM
MDLSSIIFNEYLTRVGVIFTFGMCVGCGLGLLILAVYGNSTRRVHYQKTKSLKMDD